MNVDEFIDQYGKVEILKHMKAHGDPMADKIIKAGGAARHSEVGADVYKSMAASHAEEHGDEGHGHDEIKNKLA